MTRWVIDHSPGNPSSFNNWTQDGYRVGKAVGEMAAAFDFKAWKNGAESALKNGVSITKALLNNKELSPHQSDILIKSVEVIDSIELLVREMVKKNAEPNMAGRIVGNVMYEVIVEIALGAAATAIAGAASPVIATRLISLTKKLERFGDVAKPVIEALKVVAIFTVKSTTWFWQSKRLNPLPMSRALYSQ